MSGALRLPEFIRYGSSGGPGFQTRVVAVADGQEVRSALWSGPRRRWRVDLQMLGAAERMQMLDLFLAARGRLETLLMRDWTDHSSAPDGVSAPAAGDQRLGTGAAGRAAFDLVKLYPGAGHRRRITRPDRPSLRVAVDGTERADGWDLSPGGVVIFAAPLPVPGSSVTAGFRFDVPVRFDTDQLSLRAEADGVDEAVLDLVEVWE